MKKLTKKQLEKNLAKENEELWKTGCFLKWENKCEGCGKPVSTYHHFIYRSRCKAMTYDIDNGIPVCKECHNIIHFSRYDNKRYEILNNIVKNRGEQWLQSINKKVKELTGKPLPSNWLQKENQRLQKEIKKYEKI